MQGLGHACSTAVPPEVELTASLVLLPSCLAALALGRGPCDTAPPVPPALLDAAPSSAVKPGKPYKREMLGKQVVVFRDSHGKVQCLDNICPHRWEARARAALLAGSTKLGAVHRVPRELHLQAAMLCCAGVPRCQPQLWRATPADRPASPPVPPGAGPPP